MQRAVLHQATTRQVQAQIQTKVSRVLPGHGTGAQDHPVNDDIYHDANSLLWEVFSVLGNVVGGSLLLFGMFSLPHLLAELMR